MLENEQGGKSTQKLKITLIADELQILFFVFYNVTGLPFYKNGKPLGNYLTLMHFRVFWNSINLLTGESMNVMPFRPLAMWRMNILLKHA